jgi:hypothetical protein
MRTTEPFPYEGVRELWRRCVRARLQKAMVRSIRDTTKVGSVQPVLNNKTETSIKNPDGRRATYLFDSRYSRSIESPKKVISFAE